MNETLREEGPQIYHAMYLAAQRLSPVDAAHYRIGTAVHRRIAGEPSAIVIPREVLSKNGQRRGAAWTAYADSHAGECLVTQKDGIEIDNICEAILANRQARRLIEHSRLKEQSIFWRCDETDLERKCRPDALLPGLIVDIKTTRIRNPDPQRFGKAAIGLGYHRQGAYYADGVADLVGERWRPIYIIASKVPPYCVYVSGWDSDALDLGRRQVATTLRQLAEYYEADSWKDPATETITTLEVPRWAWDEI